METVLGRYRNLIILVGVLFLQVLGLAVQVKRTSDAESTRLIRVWAVGAVTPLERSLVWGQSFSGNLWHNYFYLRGVRAENRLLKEQIDQLRLEQVRLNQDAEQAHRLQALLSFKERYISKTVAAQVIGSSGSDQSRSVYIDKGVNYHIEPDMAVITADGVVGKVLSVFPSTSLVLLINDQSSGVGAIVEKSRLQGVLRGTPNGEVMLERVMSDEQVTPGETLLTSGGDQIFPKGLPLGRVAKVAGTDSGLFLNIKVKPAANLGRLEEVLVVLAKQEHQATAEGTGRVRTADIMAQRLPSVPDKPAVSAGGTGIAGTAANDGAAKPTTVKPQPQTGVKPPTSAPSVRPKPAESDTTKPQGSISLTGAANERGTNPASGVTLAAPPETVPAPGKPAISQPKTATPATGTPTTGTPANEDDSH
jgi:rod shape-determining protein MreC